MENTELTKSEKFSAAAIGLATGVGMAGGPIVATWATSNNVKFNIAATAVLGIAVGLTTAIRTAGIYADGLRYRNSNPEP